ncbi:guanine deaminase-like [Tubulanus polymorphus]|uniref:guanine deaminase-like n=1 Tax=Tubulanus polymorphus TaxID=672921 RepID=UPI003DA20301
MASPTSDVHCYLGTFIHCTKKQTEVEILEDTVVGVQNGKIIFVKEIKQLPHVRKEFSIPSCNVHAMHFGQFMIPGFVDCHVHASQYVFCGSNLGLVLLDWLEKHTFPTEAKFDDLDFAAVAYTKAVERLLRNGTTTSCYFATIHTDSTLALCDIIEACGQRALVGKVNMDRNSPDEYTELSAKDSLLETERFIDEIRRRNYRLVEPVITPRFVPNCTEELQNGLGELAKRYDLYIQSHLSETEAECRWVSELHPNSRDYVSVYDKAGLLTNKTVMAHGIHLSDEELDLMKMRGVAIAHCPNSNISLRSGMLDARKILDRGMKIGLGTDLAGGYHPSILDAMRNAIAVSNILSVQKGDDYRPLVYQDVFRLATLGGAEALCMDERLGSFEVGKEFDALLIDPHTNYSGIDAFDGDFHQEMFQKFLFLGDDRNIIEVYVQGRKIWPQPGRMTADSRLTSCSLTDGTEFSAPVCSCGDVDPENKTKGRFSSIRRDSDFNLAPKTSVNGE